MFSVVYSINFNVLTVGDEAVNKFVASAPHADYFSNLVKFFGEQCISLDKLVVNASKYVVFIFNFCPMKLVMHHLFAVQLK